MSAAKSLLCGGWEIAALLQAFGCAVVFVRAWKCAAMWDSQNGFAEKVRWGKNLNLCIVG